MGYFHILKIFILGGAKYRNTYQRPKHDTPWIKIQKGNGIFKLVYSFVTEDVVLSVLEKIILTFAAHSTVMNSDLIVRALSTHSGMETATAELNWTVTQLRVAVGD